MIRTQKQKREERRALRMIVLVTQIGICMLVPVFFCVFLGRWISEKTGSPLLFPLMLLIGILAGFRSCWQVISRFTRYVPPPGAGARADLQGRSRGDKSSPGTGTGTRAAEDRSSPGTGPVTRNTKYAEDEWDELYRPDKPDSEDR